MSSWRVASRIARRETLRAKGRSALVLAMIALPVLGVTAVAVVARTADLTAEQQATRTYGAADITLSDSSLSSVDQLDPSAASVSTLRPEGSSVDLSVGLPEGSRGLPDVSEQGRLSVPGRTTSAMLRSLAYDDPLARGLYSQVEGRAPRGPGEVALTEGLAARLGVRVGSSVEAGSGPARTVVGVVADASSFGTRTALLAPGTLDVPGQLLVDLPAPLTAALVRSMNARGVYVQPRSGELPGAAVPAPTDLDAGELATVSLVVGMALLEVVLLAGPAFAVGARRSRQQLALLAATGADRRDVRRTVLAGAVVLGGVAAVVGAAAGIGLAGAASPFASQVTDSRPGPFEVPGLQVLGIAAIGLLTALLAAVLPAWTASRQDVVRGLTGRGAAVGTARGAPVAGLVVALAGAAIAYHGATLRNTLIVLAGSATAELGLVAMTPALVGLAGRLSPLLPAAPRLALRDASRNRARTAPAVAAVLAAVAGSVAVGTYLASLDRYQAERYSAPAPDRTAVVDLYDPADAAQAGRVGGVLRAQLGATSVTELRSITDASADIARPAGAGFPGTSSREGYSRLGYGLVGGADLLRVMSGDADPALVRVLDAGGVLVADASLLQDGRVSVVVGKDGVPQGRPVELPAAVLPGQGNGPLFSPGAVDALGLSSRVQGVVAQLPEVPSGAAQDRATSALSQLGVEDSLYVERGYASSYGLALVALAIASGLLVLGASGIATGLAAAEGRADLSTLAAVGASPGLRRRLAAFQSYVTAGLGTLLGVAAGLVPAFGLIRALNATTGMAPSATRGPYYPTVLPWGNLLVTLVVVPLLAALAAALVTRSRLPLVRRLV